MRKFTNKELVCTVVTRFAITFLTLESMMQSKQPLEAMFTSTDWANREWSQCYLWKLWSLLSCIKSISLHNILYIYLEWLWNCGGILLNGILQLNICHYIYFSKVIRNCRLKSNVLFLIVMNVYLVFYLLELCAGNLHLWKKYIVCMH